MQVRSPETPEARSIRLAKRAQYRETNRAKINAQASEYRAANKDRCYAITKEWQEKHPERMKEIKRKCYFEHQERYTAANRAFMKRHPEKARAYQARYYQKNREVILKKIAQWHARNPESRQATFGKRRAAIRSVDSDPTKIIRTWMRRIRMAKVVKCHWCGVKVSGRKCHIDHVIPLSKGGGHTVTNLCASCPPCNQKKFTKLPEDFNRELEQPLLFI